MCTLKMKLLSTKMQDNLISIRSQLKLFRLILDHFLLQLKLPSSFHQSFDIPFENVHLFTLPYYSVAKTDWFCQSWHPITIIVAHVAP